MRTLLSVLLPWLAGLTLHPATGPAVHVPLPASHASSVRLLGPAAGGGWVLTDRRGDRALVLLLRGGRLRTVRSVDDPQGGTSFRLSSDGRRVVEVDAPTTARTDVWTFGTTGRDVAHLRLPGWAELLGYDGRTVVLGRSGRTLGWRARSPAYVVDRLGAVAVDQASDVLFTFDPKAATYGPTSLARPGPQRWSLPSTDFFPRSVSPDGQLVAGLAGDPDHVQVRRMTDGSLISDWERHLAFERPLVWADADHVVSVLRTRSGWAPLRCTLGGECVRAADLSRDPVSLPFQLAP